MAYRVPATQSLGANAYTVSSVLQAVSGINPPASIAFPMLGSSTVTLGPSQGSPIQGGAVTAVVRSIGLITCASVCFVNANSTTAYVFHANAGSVSHGNFTAAMTAIGAGGGPYNGVYIAYAHPGATDPGYQSTIADLVNWGVPTHNIVEITHVFVPQFGMNNGLQIGY
ncbi:hypothetical protein ACN28I_19790 [Archangium gephyra]|uniref:hypothetical protein n=1 Tax=Archangium gephyra TaxID=48 RepID=UPI003B7C1C01